MLYVNINFLNIDNLKLRQPLGKQNEKVRLDTRTELFGYNIIDTNFEPILEFCLSLSNNIMLINAIIIY